MSFHDEDEIAEETIDSASDGGVPLGMIVEATLSHRRGVLKALRSGGFAVSGRLEREDLLQRPEGDDVNS